MKKRNFFLLLTKQMISIHRKSYLFFGITVLASVFLISFITSTFENLITSIEYNNALQFGTHHAIVYDVLPEQVESLKECDTLTSSGKITSYGNYQVKNSNLKLTIGSFDDPALDMANFELLEGRYPESSQEIVLERNVINRITDFKIGSNIQFVEKNTNFDFTVVGVIEDYSGQWNVPEEIIIGKIDLPAALISTPNEYLVTKKTAEHLLLKYEKYDESIIFSQFRDSNTDIYKGIINDNCYGMRQDDISNLKRFSNFFFIGLLIIMSVVIYSTISMILDGTKDSYRILRIIGASHKKMYASFIAQFSVIFLPCSIVGIILAAFSSSLFYYSNNSTMIQLPNISVFIRLAIFVLLVLFIIYIPYHKKILTISKSTLVQSVRKNPLMMQIKDKSVFSFAKHYFKLGISNHIFIIISLCTIVLLAGTVNYYFHGRYGDNYTISKPSFVIESSNVKVYKEFGYYRLYKTKDRAIQVNDLNRFNLDSIKYIEYIVETEGAVIFSSEVENSDYWLQFNSENISGISENPINAPDFPVCNEYTIMLANDKLISAINKEYGESEVIEKKDTILFLPNYDKTKVSKISFGIIEAESFSKAENDSSKINYAVEDMKIDKQINSTFNVNIDSIVLSQTNPVIIIPIEKLELYSVLKGIKKLSYYVEPNITKEVIRELNAELRSFSNIYPDMFFSSRYEQTERQEKNSIVINTSFTLLTALLLIFLLIVFYNTIYLLLLSRKRSLAICRIIGLGYMELRRIIFLESVMYVMLFAILSILLVCILAWLLHAMYIVMPMILVVVCISLVLLVCGNFASKRFVKLFGEFNLINLVRSKE